MFIRKTQTRSSDTAGPYFTYRLVESKRVGKKVSQHTLLNLGSNFDLPSDAWPELCTRIDQILTSQQPLFETDPIIEALAQHIYSQILARQGELQSCQPEGDSTQDFQEVDINSLEQINPRSVGAEHVSLEALKELQIPQILEDAGFSPRQINAALGNIIGRMCVPQSELATTDWLIKSSALGELLKHDFTTTSPMQLYRASDRLLKNKDFIEEKIFARVQDLFFLKPTITLYDLTNTYMEGAALANPKAKRGRSKEKRSDCPLVTLGLALDSSGFIRHSKVFEGSVSEPVTLSDMLSKLQAPEGALVIMDAGIATEKNLQWLLDHHFEYLVVSRETNRDIDMESTSVIESTSGHAIHLQRQPGEHPKEIKLACWSEQRAAKDQAINQGIRDKFEQELKRISKGLQKRGFTKKRDPINQRIGRLKEKFQRVAAHYKIDLTLDPNSDQVIALTWEFQPQPASKHTHPGVYKLRTTLIDWEDADLWRTYTMLTDLESVFRSLKSELGMRPVYHQTEDRCDGHLFITVLAYQGVQVIRRKLKENGITESWSSLREKLKRQVRVTATFKTRDGKTRHIRQATKPDEELSTIYAKLNISTTPGGQQRMIV